VPTKKQKSKFDNPKKLKDLTNVLKSIIMQELDEWQSG
jgi:hypothetical protein